MNKLIGPTIPLVAGAAALILTFSVYAAEQKHEHTAPHLHEQAGNPLIEEMVKLDEVFRDVVSGVAAGDGRRVHEALEQMHGAMEKTHEGVPHGTVTLRKNATRMNEFVAQDKQFHTKLEDLARAAEKNDWNVMLGLTKDLLDRCVKCHKDFRP